MAVEEGFIQYTVEVKGAAKVSQDFKAIADQALKTGTGFERLEQYVNSLSERYPKLSARLRDSAKYLEAYSRAQREAARGGSRDIDDRYDAYVREAAAMEAAKKKLAELTERRKAEVELQKSLDQLKVSERKSGIQDDESKIGKEAAARKELARALKEQALAQKELQTLGDPGKTAFSKGRYDETAQAADRLTKANGRVTEAQRRMGTAFQDANRGIISQRYALYDTSNMLGLVGGALSGVGIYATVVGAQFEASFANVERTLDPAEFAAGELGIAIDGIRSSLVQLTGQLPLTFAELSQIATIGNQMGIAEGDLMDFTSTIARFASVSGMSIEEVSKSFGGFMAQTGLAPKYLENLASSLAYVSIKSNATEAQILSVSREIAALSTGAGMSADQVVGFAGALASLQIPAERARGSLDTYFGTLKRAVAEGGQDLNNFATVVGVTASELDSMVRAGKGADVLEGFLTNLNKLDSVSITKALDDLNLSQLRVSNTFTRLSQNVDSVGNHMRHAQSSFIEGAELNRQYEITLDTLNAQWIIFTNGINGLINAISGGAIPGLGELLQMVNGVMYAMIDFLQRHKWAAYILAFGAALVTVSGTMLIFRSLVMRGQASLLAFATAAGITTRVNIGAMGSLRGLIGGFVGVTRAANGATGAVATFNRVLSRSLIGLLVVGAGVAIDSLFGISKSADAASLSLGEYNDITQQARDVSMGAGDGASNLADQLGGGGGGGGGVAKAAEEAAEKVRLLTDYASDLAGIFGRSFSIQFDSGAAMDDVILKWIKIREESEKYQEEINKLTADRKLKEYWLGIAEMYDDQLRAGQLRSEIADIDKDLAKANEGASRELKGNSKAAIENRKTMRDLVRGYQDYIEALAASGASQEFIQSEIKRLNREFRDQGVELGYNSSELDLYSKSFSNMSTIVAQAPRDVTLEFNGDPALQALAEFNAKLAEQARAAADAAGAGAGDAFGDAMGGALGDAFGDLDSLFGDFDDANKKSIAKTTSKWDAFAGFMAKLWWNIGHGAIVAISAIYEGVLGLASGIESFMSGGDFAEGFKKGALRAEDDFRSMFGQIGWVGAEAMNAEFENGEKIGEILLDGVTYALDPATNSLRRVGALSAEAWNDGLGEGIIPGPILVDGVSYAEDPVTGEIYRVGTSVADEYNRALAAGTMTAPVLVGDILYAKDLTNGQIYQVGTANGKEYNGGLKAVTNPGAQITSKFDSQRSQINTAARNSGSSAGWQWWEEFKSFWNFEWLTNSASSIAKSTAGKGKGGKGYQAGGYTGNMGVSSVAGVVHGREYVIPAHGVDQRTKLPRADYVASLQRGKSAPRGKGGAGYQSGGFVGGGGAIELGEYSLGRIARDVSVSLRVDNQELASAASGGDARLAGRGSN